MALCPTGDSCLPRCASEKNGLARALHRSGDVVQFDVFENEGSASWGIGILAAEGENANRSVTNFTVYHEDGANSHFASAGVVVLHVDGYLAIFDYEALICPTPVPKLVDSCHGIANFDIDCCELLITERHAVPAAIDGDIGEKSARTVFNKDTFVPSAGVFGHRDLDVLQARRLTCGPVDTADVQRWWNCCHINLEVTHLAEESVHAGPSEVSCGLILVAIYDPGPAKARSRFDDW